MTRNKWLAVVAFVFAALNFLVAAAALVWLAINNLDALLIAIALVTAGSAVTSFVAGVYFFLEG